MRGTQHTAGVKENVRLPSGAQDARKTGTGRGVAGRASRLGSVGACAVVVVFALSASTVVQRTDAAPAPDSRGGCLGKWHLLAHVEGAHLRDVAVLSPHNVWAVGTIGDATHRRALTAHWNGHRLSLTRGLPDVYLSAIAALSPTNIWAVGSKYETSAANHALIRHWNGRRWQTARPAGVGALADVVALSSTAVWAVGTSSREEEQALVMRWNGRIWQKHLLYSEPDNRLYAAAATSASDVWVAGSFGGYYQLKTEDAIAAHWNGRRWRDVPVPARDDSDLDEESGPTDWVDDLAAASPDEAWNIHNSYVRSDIQRWNGRRWRVVHVFPRAIDLAAVVAFPGEAWAFGGKMGHPYLLHWDGRGWKPFRNDLADATGTLAGAASLSRGMIWAVGDGLLARYTAPPSCNAMRAASFVARVPATRRVTRTTKASQGRAQAAVPGKHPRTLVSSKERITEFAAGAMAPAGSAPSLAHARGAVSGVLPAPRTLVTTKPIVVFAQDGGRLAWINVTGLDTPRCNSQLRILALAPRRSVSVPGVGWCKSGDGIWNVVYPDARLLWLGGDRALWIADVVFGNTEMANSFRTASARDPHARLIDHAFFNRDTDDPFPSAAGAAGSVLFYRETCPGFANSGAGSRSSGCDPTVKRVVGRKAVKLFKPTGPGRTIGLAKTSNRIALIKYVVDQNSGGLLDETLVELRSSKGALLKGFRSPGQPRAVALGADDVALLTESGRQRSLRVFDAETGAARAVVPVRGMSDALAASGRWIAFVEGKTIRLLDATTGSVSAAVETATYPIDVSISGGRLAWAENSAHRGRIRAVSLPRSAFMSPSMQALRAPRQ